MTTHRFVVSGFADEIGHDLEEQLDVLEDLGIDNLDLRGVKETNVLDFSDEQVERIKGALDERGIGVTSIGSPIGKIDVTDDFEPHFDRFETALEMADTFDTDYIRLFSYYIPEGDDPADHREEVMRRMTAKAERAEEAGVTLLHENEKDIYGDTPERCRDMLTTVDSPNFRAIFDPANFLEIGVTPYPDALLQLVEYVEQLHIKDGVKGERGEIVPAGEGDGNIPETLAAFKRRGFDGPASLEPHLTYAGPKSGFSGPEGYEIAADALFDCFESVDASYE
ncbi:sugar phosphate isomerase/epimerase family protein [Halomontanus rarus]|uniref:sugar phosphate isomerase/epimerase family protein n=1 Tax=Halomontanus rarus TaxID=3034020 RepID=UPI0023E82CAD|nr:sugar phosphate isomerase/epimerase family protein [Halovivax sp. TS33]